MVLRRIAFARRLFVGVGLPFPFLYLPQEKEHWMLEAQLLQIKMEKEQKVFLHYAVQTCLYGNVLHVLSSPT